MGNLGQTYKVKHKNTYDTDRYEERYFITSGRFEKTIWGSGVFVGPGAYNMGHIDNVLNPRKNDVDDVRDSKSPFFRIRVLSNRESAKFKP